MIRAWASIRTNTDLPLPDGAFDAVTGNFVINAVGDPAAAEYQGKSQPMKWR